MEERLFQALGVISGVVSIVEDSRLAIAIKGNTYSLLFVKNRRKVYQSLFSAIQSEGSKERRIAVYPKVIHFPGKDKPHIIAFQIIGIESERNKPDSPLRLFNDFEFKLCGLWQFIPVCKIPCITVLRNSNDFYRQQLKVLEPDKKARFLKASHIPLLWRDNPVPPFRFDPKINKDEQGKPYFVQVKARFIPSKDLFGFESLQSLPTEDCPRFLKFRKHPLHKHPLHKVDAKKCEPKRPQESGLEPEIKPIKRLPCKA